MKFLRVCCFFLCVIGICIYYDIIQYNLVYGWFTNLIDYFVFMWQTFFSLLNSLDERVDNGAVWDFFDKFCSEIVALGLEDYFFERAYFVADREPSELDMFYLYHFTAFIFLLIFWGYLVGLATDERGRIRWK